jgi:predicted ester cyclase
MSEANKAIVRKIEEHWDKQELDQLDMHFAPSFNNKQNALPMVPPGIAGAKMAHQGTMKSFPDRKVEILDMISDGDKVFVRTLITGTDHGGFMGPPSHQPIRIESWGVYTIKDGKVVEHVGLNDGFTLALQVGLLKLPARG